MSKFKILEEMSERERELEESRRKRVLSMKKRGEEGWNLTEEIMDKNLLLLREWERESEETGRSMQEIERAFLCRRVFERRGRGEEFDRLLHESRKEGIDLMDFVKRLQETGVWPE